MSIDAGSSSSEAAIPLGLIIVGPNTTAYTNIVRSLSLRLEQDRQAIVVDIVPSQATNLKSALKLINSHAANKDSDVEAEDPIRHDQVPTPFSLLSLEGLTSFQDGEAFDGALLSELIELLGLWSDRIPFVCLFGIKTSVELFQDKLRRATIRLLQGVQFEVAKVDVDRVFRAVIFSDKTGLFWLGHGVSKLILGAQKSSVQSIASFARSLQYACMTHLFANPLTILLQEPLQSAVFQQAIYECVRNLDSFRQFAESSLDQKDVETTRRLLNDDVFLHKKIASGIKQGKEALKRLVDAVELLSIIQTTLQLKSMASWSELYILAMAGELKDSATIRDTLLTLKRLSSKAMLGLLEHLADLPSPDLSTLTRSLRDLEVANEGVGPLRSEYDTRHESLRTTVVSHKVELSKHSSSLSKQDMAYTKLVNQINTTLSDYFEQSLISPPELFLHEALIFDLKSPHREVFAPKPRYAIERALSSPSDYLGCSCCKSAEHGLSATHPATSILYQLYLESGAVINISDLWSAFYTIFGTDNAGDEDEDAEQKMALYVFRSNLRRIMLTVTESALFSQALAELKFMGMIKNSRKKADHLDKVLWNGL
ncbi:MAG: hypothetical protein Q9179_005755 [Wetmoreana sp. 5 TL-2023]